MNIEIIKLQRELLLEQLMEVENQLNDNGIKIGKKSFTIFPVKRKNGESVLYVRYTDLETGKQIPTKKCLDTNDRAEAEKKAIMCREANLKTYYDRKKGIKDVIQFFDDYYDLEKSVYLQERIQRKEINVSDFEIKKYRNFIRTYFVPFLNEKSITRIENIKLSILREFQSFCLNKKLSPQTINDRLSCAIKPIFNNLVLKEVISKTPFPENVRFNLPEKDTKKERHIPPVYETLAILMETEMWKMYKERDDISKDNFCNEKHYKKFRLYCMLMATTGLRNAEIFMLRKENITTIRTTKFLDINNSHIGKTGVKTKNSIRKVPIPSITLRALEEYIDDNNITDYLFYKGGKTIQQKYFMFAKNQFGAHLGYTEKELEEMNFDFYSFRHFYNTMLRNSKINPHYIKYFMGHSRNTAKMDENYLHIGDLDDILFEEKGIEVIDYIDGLCKDVMEKQNIFPFDYHIEEISLSNDKKQIINYYTNVLDKYDFENEIHYFIEDLYDKGSFLATNDDDILIELKNLLDKEIIDKRRYNECVYYINSGIDGSIKMNLIDSDFEEFEKNLTGDFEEAMRGNNAVKIPMD